MSNRSKIVPENILKTGAASAYYVKIQVRMKRKQNSGNL